MKLEIQDWCHNIYLKFTIEDIKNDIKHKQLNKLSIYRLT